MARCPACDDTLTETLHEAVRVRLCNRCGGTWAAFGDLRDLHGSEPELELTAEETARRCAACRSPLVRGKLDARLDVEACAKCRSVFFAEGQLSKFKPPSGKSLQAVRDAGMFTCVKCGQRFPLGRGTLIAGGLACRACAGLDALDEVRAERERASAAVDWVATHRLPLIIGGGFVFGLYLLMRCLH